MRIAVASADGRRVAARMQEAACFLIFNVDGDCIGAHIERPVPTGIAATRRTSDSPSASEPYCGIDAASADEGPPSVDEWDAETLYQMLPALADCSFLLVGAVTPAVASVCAGLGIAALPIGGCLLARDAVQFTVTGRPPAGEECHRCGPGAASVEIQRT